jgi:hypothetical protein
MCSKIVLQYLLYVFWIKMASHEQCNDDYEISCLVCDSDDSEANRHSDDIGLIGSEDEEGAVEEHLDDDIDSMYDVADAGDHGQLENADDEHSETGENTNKKMNVFQGKDFTGAGHLPTFLEQDTSHSCSSSQRQHNSASSWVCG